MATPHEAATFAYRQGIFGCFSVPRKKEQWIYGYLHHNIGLDPSEDCGTFVMEDGTLDTFPLRIVDAATLRLLKGDKFHSPCHQGFDAAKARIQKMDFAFRSAHPEDWKQLRAELHDQSLRKYRETYPLKTPKEKARPKPKPAKASFPIKTPVAARSGSKAPFAELETWTACGWWVGSLVRFEPKNTEKPYVIKFSTKPKSATVRVSEPVVKQLSLNYQYCDEHCIFQGIVGLELLWPTLSPNNTGVLRFTKVLELNRITQLYTLSFRDGKTFDLSGPMLDRATTRDEHIKAGTEVSLEVNEGEPSLVVFSEALIKQAKAEQGRYKLLGPVMSRGRKGTGQYGSDFSSETESSGEESDSDDESQASTASSRAADLAKKKSRGSLGGTTIEGTQDDVTLIGSHGASKGEFCTCTCTMCRGYLPF